MRSAFPVTICMLALAGAWGCSATDSNTDPYERAAQEVESAASALDQDDTGSGAIDAADDESTDNGTADDDGDSDEAADEATDGGHRGHGDGRGHHGGGHHRRHGRGHHHGRGHDLLLWYADLDALQVCRDLRDTCQASADPSTCKDDVKACVEPVIADAFAAMCEERIAMCSADDANGRACERVHKHCDAATAPPVDAGTPSP